MKISLLEKARYMGKNKIHSEQNRQDIVKLHKKYFIHKKKSYPGKKIERLKWKASSYFSGTKKHVLSPKKFNRVPKKFISVFNQSSYLHANSDIQHSIDNGKFETPLEHFIFFGYDEVKSGERRIGSEFPFLSEKAYKKAHPDVVRGIADGKFSSAFEHFLFFGYEEFLTGERELPGRFPFKWTKSLKKHVKNYFDEAAYLKVNADIVKAIKNGDFKNGWEHFLLFGLDDIRNGKRTLHSAIPKFSENIYALENEDIFDTEKYAQCHTPFEHFLQYGAQEIIEGKRIVNGYTASEKIRFLPLPLVDKPVKKIDLKIAVVIHAFYIDVLEDIISSIDHISPRPDLFISVSEDANIKEIEQFFKERAYLNFVITPVQNRGRDVAPFLAEFAETLKSYDLCCKIHGKKSLYGGSEQTNWRNHLYHNLLGSKEIVDDILSAFVENEKLGLLFSDNYGMIPYWGYSWLTNKGVVGGLLQRLKLQELSPILNQTYIDYPAGTMFWFRPAAISQILDSDIGYKDFPEEPIGNDGTLAHGLERLFAYVTRLNGYDYIEQNRKMMQYTQNITHKNFNQHQAKTLETAKNIVLEKECIIFDIFDTLVTRTIFYPDNIFRIIEQEFDEKFSIRSDFMKVRKETEYQLRMSEEHSGDVSYEDIYDHIHLYSDYTVEMVAYLREKDFEYELEILIPKPDTIALLQYAYDNNIEILFVSDMYLTKLQVMAILKKQNIPFKEENVMVSSDTGYRKDNTTVWKHLVETKRINPSKTLMIGDSEVSDAKLPGDFGIETFHLLSERNAFLESPFGKAFSQQFGQLSEQEMLLMGPVVNQIFSSAFELSETVLDFSKKCTPYSFGYTAFGPFFYMFVNNIYRKFSDKRVFFLARDGFFLQQTLETFLETKDLTMYSQVEYLQISRRAMLGAVMKNAENLANMILDLGNYKGMFSAMIYSRVGLDESFLFESGIEDFKIDDEADLEKAYEILLKHLDLINDHAKHENRAYYKYLESIGFFEESEDVLIDLGYSGTIQNYLHQLTGEKLTGEYFVTTEKVNGIEGDNNCFKGYFADKIDHADNSNIVYKYALVLESFLTSDKGQLICYTEEKGKIMPKYKEKNESIEVQVKMMEGIRDYISALSIVPPDFIDTDSDRLKDIALFTYEYMILHRLLDDEIRGILYLEDEFSGSKALDIMNILAERGI